MRNWRCCRRDYMCRLFCRCFRVWIRHHMLERFHPTSDLVAMCRIRSGALSFFDRRDLLSFLPPEAETHLAYHGVLNLIEHHQDEITTAPTFQNQRPPSNQKLPRYNLWITVRMIEPTRISK